MGWTFAARRMRRRRRLGQAEVAHLPRLDQLGHRADGVLDRRLRIDAVLVVEVDHVHAESLQAGVAALPDVWRVARERRGTRPCGPRTLANFVARTTRSRRPRIALPTRVSLRPMP